MDWEVMIVSALCAVSTVEIIKKFLVLKDKSKYFFFYIPMPFFYAWINFIAPVFVMEGIVALFAGELFYDSILNFMKKKLDKLSE